MSLITKYIGRAAAFGLALSVSMPAYALQQAKFEAAAFKSAQDAGQRIVVHVTAPWCPTCKAQHTAIDSLAGQRGIR